MPYNAANPPRLGLPRGLDGSETGCGIFFYTSPTDAAGVIGSPGYFPDGVRYGMTVGDMLTVWDQVNQLIVVFFVASFTGSSPNFELFSGGGSAALKLARFVTGSSDAITANDFGGTIAWLNVTGGTQTVIAGLPGQTFDVTFVDQEPLTESNSVAFTAVGCTINGQSTRPGLIIPYQSITLRWDGNNNWMEI